jgi:hypothetical protein
MEDYIEDMVERHGFPLMQDDGTQEERIPLSEQGLEMAKAVYDDLIKETEMDGEDEIEIFRDPVTGQEIEPTLVVDLRNMIEKDSQLYSSTTESDTEEGNETVAPVVPLDDHRGKHKAIQAGEVSRKRGRGGKGTAPVANQASRGDNTSMGEQRQMNVIRTPEASEDPDTDVHAAPVVAAPLSMSARPAGGQPTKAEAPDASDSAPTGSPAPASRQTFIPASRESGAATATASTQSGSGEQLALWEPEASAPERTGRFAWVSRALGSTALGKRLAARGRKSDGSNVQPGPLPAEHRENKLREWKNRVSGYANRKPQGWTTKALMLGGVALEKSRAFSDSVYKNGKDYYTDPEKGRRRVLGAAAGVVIVGAVAVYLHKSGNLDLLNNFMVTPDDAPNPDLVQISPNGGVGPEVVPPHAGDVAPDVSPAPVAPEAPTVHTLDISLKEGSNPWNAIAENMGFSGELDDRQTYIVDALKDYAVQHDLRGLDDRSLQIGQRFTIPEWYIREVIEQSEKLAS